MASLTLTIGALSATVSADNAKASNVLSQYADSIGATGTNQQRANAVVLALVRYMQEQARRHRRDEAKRAALLEAQEELSELAWED